jgi:uracil-DNA glycosylase family 4
MQKGHAARQKIVFSVRNMDANILFCRETSGRYEETIGEALAGRAGQLLIKIIVAIGRSSRDVYIADIIN